MTIIHNTKQLNQTSRRSILQKARVYTTLTLFPGVLFPENLLYV
jgi:hypothetical protein